jgi:hypothetical protein
MKLTIYIKNKSSYLKVYWIKRNNQNITGWFNGSLYQSMLYSTVEDIDIHFTYPPDGRLHYTIKSKSRDIGERFFVKSEKNKLNKEGNVSVEGKITNLFNHMLPDYTPPTYAEFSSSSKFFQFPMAGISYLNGNLFYPSLKRESDIKASSYNIVVDLDLYNDITINPCAMLLGKDYNLDSFLTNTKMSIIDDTSFPIIVLFVNISPK